MQYVNNVLIMTLGFCGWLTTDASEMAAGPCQTYQRQRGMLSLMDIYLLSILVFILACLFV